MRLDYLKIDHFKNLNDFEVDFNEASHEPVTIMLGGNGSGDIFLAFSTANPNAARGNEKGLAPLQSLSNNFIDPLLTASAYATEEAIINSMIAAEDMIGHKGFSVKALPHDELQEIMRKYNRL